MFLDNSRYARVRQETVKTRSGRDVTVVALRRLPRPVGQPHLVVGSDQLDVMAMRQYSEPTWYWHIADANTSLQAQELLRESNREIQVPEQ